VIKDLIDSPVEYPLRLVSKNLIEGRLQVTMTLIDDFAKQFYVR